MAQQLPPMPNGNALLKPNARRQIDNRPVWMTQNHECEKMGLEEKETNPEDARRKRGRICSFSQHSCQQRGNGYSPDAAKRR